MSASPECQVCGDYIHSGNVLCDKCSAALREELDGWRKTGDIIKRQFDEVVGRLATAEAALEEAKAILKDNELQASDDWGSYCTECSGYADDKGHKPDCRWSLWLQKYGDK